jgi:hypothetical protein
MVTNIKSPTANPAGLLTVTDVVVLVAVVAVPLKAICPHPFDVAAKKNKKERTVIFVKLVKHWWVSFVENKMCLK